MEKIKNFKVRKSPEKMQILNFFLSKSALNSEYMHLGLGSELAVSQKLWSMFYF